MDESVKASAIPDQQNEASFESELLPEGDSGTASTKFGTMDEDVAAAATTDQQNKEDNEPEVLPEESSDAPEDLDVGASAHPEDTKDQDLEESYHPELP